MDIGWIGCFLISLSTVLVVLIVKELLQRKKIEYHVATEGEHETIKQDLYLKDLSQYTGDQDAPIYVAVAGHIFDVTRAKKLYGPGATYHVFAGHDASYGLGKTCLKPHVVDKPIHDLCETELDRMNEWKQLYQRKYPLVGKLLDPPQ